MSNDRMILIPERHLVKLGDDIQNYRLHAHEVRDSLLRWRRIGALPDIESADAGESMQVPLSVIGDMFSRVFDTELQREPVIKAIYDLFFLNLEAQPAPENREENSWNFRGVNQYPYLSSDYVNALTNFKEDGRTIESMKDDILRALGMTTEEIDRRDIEEANRRMIFTVILPFDPERVDEVRDWYENTYLPSITHEVRLLKHGVPSKTGTMIVNRNVIHRDFQGAALILTGRGYVHPNSLDPDFSDDLFPEGLFDLDRIETKLRIVPRWELDQIDEKPEKGFKPRKD